MLGGTHNHTAHRILLSFLVTSAVLTVGVICFLSLPLSAQTQGSQAASIKVEGAYRYISSYGMPRHAGDRAQALGIEAVPYAFKVTSKPETQSPTPVGDDMFFGVALDGVPFALNRGVLWQNKAGWRFYDDSFDQYGGALKDVGRYVYASIPRALISKDLSHVGYAADGFPIFVSKENKFKTSYRLKEGKRTAKPEGPGGQHDGRFLADYDYVPGSGSLDQCNGVLVNEKYYIYVLTSEFPHVPLCWSGTPDLSFKRLDWGGAQQDEAQNNELDDVSGILNQNLRRRGRL